MKNLKTSSYPRLTDTRQLFFSFRFRKYSEKTKQKFEFPECTNSRRHSLVSFPIVNSLAYFFPCWILLIFSLVRGLFGLFVSLAFTTDVTGLVKFWLDSSSDRTNASLASIFFGNELSFTEVTFLFSSVVFAEVSTFEPSELESLILNFGSSSWRSLVTFSFDFWSTSISWLDFESSEHKSMVTVWKHVFN